MNIIGLDPGPTQSALVLYQPGKPGRILRHVTSPNAECREWLLVHGPTRATLVVEYMRPRGMPTSVEEMDTMFELGRMVESWGGVFEKVGRQDVKLHLCGSARGNDATVRQALIDRWGGSAATRGPKKCTNCGGKGWYGRDHTECQNFKGDWPGDEGCFESPAGALHGITGDQWSALAISAVWSELHPAI